MLIFFILQVTQSYFKLGFARKRCIVQSLHVHPQESRKFVALALDTTLSFGNGRSGNLSLVFSSSREVASCRISIASSSSFIEELSIAAVIVGVWFEPVIMLPRRSEICSND